MKSQQPLKEKCGDPQTVFVMQSNLKTLLLAIMNMNDISSQGNNQIVECISDYYSVWVRCGHRYLFQILNVSPHTIRGDRFDH